MKLACITIDFERDLWSPDYDVELLHDQAKIDPLKSIIHEYDVKLTAFLVTKFIERNPGLIEKARSEFDMQFEVHSHSHNLKDTESKEEIDESVAAYENYFGNRPKGYRAPNGLISHTGLERLAERGFQYDASVFPSIRFDEYAYNNVSVPIEPYQYKTPAGDILELPFGVVRTVRFVMALSYIKVCGWNCFRMFADVFGLPETVIIDTHFHDFFIEPHLERIPGWKRWAHARNAHRALSLFEKLLAYLRNKGYQFVYVDDVIRSLDRSKLHTITLNNVTQMEEVRQ